jgi:hypothetical protein
MHARRFEEAGGLLKSLTRMAIESRWLNIQPYGDKA